MWWLTGISCFIAVCCCIVSSAQHDITPESTSDMIVRHNEKNRHCISVGAIAMIFTVVFAVLAIAGIGKYDDKSHSSSIATRNATGNSSDTSIATPAPRSTVETSSVVVSSYIASNTSSATDSKSSITLGQSNALKSAKQYLDYSGFSYSGLIDQLKYEGYTTVEAEYGADHCGADWSQQAVKVAKSYLKYTSFSKSGLIDQLKYDGFTTAQATYAVEQCGF